jgi:hypothetical protein
MTPDFELADALIDGNKKSTVEKNTALDRTTRVTIPRGVPAFVGTRGVTMDQC